MRLAQGDTAAEKLQWMEGKERAPGPGPRHTSSRSVRALGFSRYFSRARQAEMRSGLSSILPGADKREVYFRSAHLGLPADPRHILRETGHAG